jgi:hypothetical protein
MVVLLIASGFLNYYLTNNTPVDTGDNDTGVASWVTMAKSQRQMRRNEEMAFYDAIINSETTTAEAKQAAEAAKLQIINNIEIETNVETYVMGKGHQAAVVTCSTNSINVVVVDNDLTGTEVSVIKNYIIGNTDYKLNQIYITPYTV